MLATARVIKKNKRKEEKPQMEPALISPSFILFLVDFSYFLYGSDVPSDKEARIHRTLSYLSSILIVFILL